MFQLEKRKKICGSRRKEEEEVSSESEGDVPSNVLSQQDVSLSNDLTIENVLKQCSKFKQKKRKKRQRLAVLKKMKECKIFFKVQDHIKQYWFSEHGLILTFRPSRKGYHFDCICEGQWSQ